MEKRRYTVLSNTPVAAGAYRLDLLADNSEFVPEGEFVDVSVPGFFLRRPLSICDSHPGYRTLVYKVIGQGTEALSDMPEGAELEVLTGLGRGFDPEACRERALLVGGGLGVPPLLLLAKRLKARGKHVTAVLGFNTADDVLLVKQFRQVCEDILSHM